jgi:hypothetical protein
MDKKNMLLTSKIDLSSLDISFTKKPVIIGGLAMEYYGIRECGDDIDFIVSNEDYLELAKKYPNHKKDKWGDLGVLIDDYECLRSIFRLDYDFYSVGAIEFDQYKIIALDRLLFMKVLAFYNQPEVDKHTKDYDRMMDFYIKHHQNKTYVEFGNQYINQYLNAPDGTIYNGEYIKDSL